jgi:RNA-directed DNA polymerase
MSMTYEISKKDVFESWLKVKKNGGGAGIDGVSVEDFEKNLKNNLYKIWARMSSGSYFPPSVKGVEIPKKTGGVRLLGIPTVGDRVAQNVVVGALEPILEPIFCRDSYGYRPNKSAHDALAVTRARCWERNWVLEFDIRGLFDNIPHDLLTKALQSHVSKKWILLYVDRWLKASTQMPNGTTVERTAGTPQGGCVSPLLANLFMHYAFDKWMARENPTTPWCRYADDGAPRTQVALFKRKEA